MKKGASFEIGPNGFQKMRFARKQNASRNPVQFQIYLPSPMLHLVETGSNENFIDLVKQKHVVPFVSLVESLIEGVERLRHHRIAQLCGDLAQDRGSFLLRQPGQIAQSPLKGFTKSGTKRYAEQPAHRLLDQHRNSDRRKPTNTKIRNLRV